MFGLTDGNMIAADNFYGQDDLVESIIENLSDEEIYEIMELVGCEGTFEDCYDQIADYIEINLEYYIDEPEDEY